MLPKPAAVPPSQLPEDVKKKLAEKAKSLPGYRTKICNNYENEGMCQYDDMCHYAHGKELKLKYPRLLFRDAPFKLVQRFCEKRLFWYKAKFK